MVSTFDIIFFSLSTFSTNTWILPEFQYLCNLTQTTLSAFPPVINYTSLCKRDTVSRGGGLCSPSQNSKMGYNGSSKHTVQRVRIVTKDRKCVTGRTIRRNERKKAWIKETNTSKDGYAVGDPIVEMTLISCHPFTRTGNYGTCLNRPIDRSIISIVSKVKKNTFFFLEVGFKLKFRKG